VTKENIMANNDYIELTYRSITCFSNDGQLMKDELQDLLAVALRDGVVDDDEKRVLQNIFNRLTASELTAEMNEMIARITEAHF